MSTYEENPDHADTRRVNLLSFMLWTISGRTSYLRYIDQNILKEIKIRMKNVTMEWIDYKSAYDAVPQPWKIVCLNKYKIFNEALNFIIEAMKNWKGN